jgi:hypothetical protein
VTDVFQTENPARNPAAHACETGGGPETESLDVELSEDQARSSLAKMESNCTPRPSIRTLAELWGWHRSRVERFLKKFDADKSRSEPPTPTERRGMFIARAEDFNRLYPPGPGEAATAEQQVDEAIAAGVVSLAPADDEKDLCWSIPRQARIECSMTTTDGELEIWQEGQHGPGEDSRIFVARGSAVRLARNILYAAGFKSIGIYEQQRGGGCIDLEDGALPSSNEPKPGYGPMR